MMPAGTSVVRQAEAVDVADLEVSFDCSQPGLVEMTARTSPVLWKTVDGGLEYSGMVV